MDKILSARVDESVIQQIGMLARELNMSKKAVIEAAVKLYSEQIGLEREIDVFENTCGAWKRSETPQESIAKVRSVFNKSMERYHR
jgi:predicted DNA-binding transcriptional regulator